MLQHPMNVIIMRSNVSHSIILCLLCPPGEDGKLLCPKCKRSFARQRQYNTHICGASNAHSDYVDLSLKDNRIDLDMSDDEEEEEDVNASADPSVEYK